MSKYLTGYWLRTAAHSLFDNGYLLGASGHWQGAAYSPAALMRGDIPEPTDEWYRGHRAGVIARYYGVHLGR